MFRVQKVASPRFRRFRCSMGSHGLGSVPEVWTELVLGTGFREPEFRAKVPKVTLYLESVLLYLESIFLYFEVSPNLLVYKVLLVRRSGPKVKKGAGVQGFGCERFPV